jgi:hypothetical protein
MGAAAIDVVNGRLWRLRSGSGGGQRTQKAADKATHEHSLPEDFDR